MKTLLTLFFVFTALSHPLSAQPSLSYTFKAEKESDKERIKESKYGDGKQTSETYHSVSPQATCPRRKSRI
ncbi:MAG: hypothetical protein HC904_00770 [Blastochloris sp.]|nr:hypothetical protein [Blastochloris sp.]